MGCVGLWKFFTNGRRNKFVLIPCLVSKLSVHKLMSVQPMTRSQAKTVNFKTLYSNPKEDGE